MEASKIQSRTLRLLFIAQVISGIGIAIGSSVGALLAADIAGIGVSGLAISTNVVGAALFAVPATAIVHRYGRRLSLAAGYCTAALGSILLVTAAVENSIPILFLGFFFFGGATAAGLQARYAAVDLAPAAVRGRHLSLVVWATTIGAIIGPSLAPVAGRTVGDYGVPTLAGPFVFSAMLLGLAALLLFGLLRPDPAVVARELFGASDPAKSAARTGIGDALRLVASLPAARLGVSAMAIGHVVMVGVMTMTPVHIRGAGHGAEYTLRIVGVVLSFHIAGMFAFAPVVGWLTDRIGRRPVIFAGIAILLT
ncbi:MAG TPA: MFS transporter, partial [Gemmatimonadales bacterium]|nr:MFS transporter [Gemmatimonadales bacterium]